MKIPTFFSSEKTHSVWQKIVTNDRMFWENAKKTANGKRILIATNLGGYNHGAIVESMLAVSLTLRSAHVEVLLCDRFLPACQMTKIGRISPETLVSHGQMAICNDCYAKGIEIFFPLGLSIHRLSSFVTDEKKELARTLARQIKEENIESFRYEGIAVGEHAHAGALRFYGRGDLSGEKEKGRVLRKYLEASLLTVCSVQELLSKHTYDAVCFHHGIYVPQGIVGEVCRKKRVRVVNWNPAYRKHCFIFSHHDTYHHTMITESTRMWENLPLTGSIQGKLDEYLQSRWQGKEDWIRFNKNPIEKKSDIEKRVGIDFSRPTITMLTNVMWDARLHYVSNAFPDMLSWVWETIDYFARHPALQLIIRVHPAEITGLVPSRQKLCDEIRKKYRRLPKNVFLIPPESKISTYAISAQSNAVLIYNTKTGIEIASIGIPVIVAGEAWIRGKGFSRDASSKHEYRRILDLLPFERKMTQKQKLRAKKYAFHFFFRRMIPLPFVQKISEAEFSLNIQNINELMPGKYEGLDVICNGILSNRPFVYKQEKRI